MEYNRRKIGSSYEEKAAVFLEKNGLVILARNFRSRYGEIDLIARDGRYFVFVEVKYRKNGESGGALAAVDRRKQRVISRVAEFYLYRFGLGENVPCRFDVVGIDGDEITWIRNAFEA